MSIVYLKLIALASIILIPNSTTDPNVCGDPEIMANMPCDLYTTTPKELKNGKNKFLLISGIRCNGSKKECIVPWYRSLFTLTSSERKHFATKCADKSDQVHNIGAACPNSTHYLNIWKSIFCPIVDVDNLDPILQGYKTPVMLCRHDSKFFRNRMTDKIEELKYHDVHDPHNCWSSCQIPGENCLACTNSSYFQCPLSGQCVHPELVCDGHPACHHAEDEEVDMCRGRYLEKKIVPTSATYRCKSRKYPGKLSTLV